MELKNDALQELYDKLLNGPVLSSPYAESPVDMAFKECDEKICDKVIELKKKIADLRDDNDKLCDKAIEVAKKNEQLEKDLDAKSKENSTLVSANADLSDRNAKLQRNFDRINHLWTGQIQENMELRSKITNMQREKKNYETIAKEREDLLKEKEWVEKQLNHYKSIYYDLSDRAHRAEDEVKDLKKKLGTKSKENSALIFTNAKLDKDLKDSWQNNDGWRSRALKAEKRVGELLLKKYDQAFEDLRKERDRYSGLYTELKKDYDRLFKENRSLKEKVVDLKKRIAELQKKGDDLSKKAVALQQEIEELEKSRKCYRQLHVGEGARHLWGMLQNVNDSQPYEFDVECKSMEDVIGMDLDDFLDAYKKWQKEKEQNEIDRMRDWLADFCCGRVCAGCPLESNEYNCCCGLSFIKVDLSDDRIIPDKDIKRYYEKARGCGQYTLKDAKLFATTVEGVNRAITKACEGFCEAVKDADIKITENLRKGCTLEAKVEVNKDLLEKVCGVEHQLEYGDAVRVPWRDYDYMYIGPEGNHIRLFNPKTHSVVIVPATENLPYQGCKIVLYDEDDIRKIWKDKK